MIEIITKEELRAMRKSLKMTQGEFAIHMGLVCRTLRDLEGGHSPIRPIHVAAANWAVLSAHKRYDFDMGYSKISYFKIGDYVRKIRGASWQGHICGTYSTILTPIGYGVESEREPGSVQIYPASALELVPME